MRHVRTNLHAHAAHVHGIFERFPKRQSQLLSLGLSKVGAEELFDVVELRLQHALVGLHDGGTQHDHAQGKVSGTGRPCMALEATTLAPLRRPRATFDGQAVVREHLPEPVAHDTADRTPKGPADGAADPFGVTHQAP